MPMALDDVSTIKGTEFDLGTTLVNKLHGSTQRLKSDQRSLITEYYFKLKISFANFQEFDATSSLKSRLLLNVVLSLQPV